MLLLFKNLKMILAIVATCGLSSQHKKGGWSSLAILMIVDSKNVFKSWFNFIATLQQVIDSSERGVLPDSRYAALSFSKRKIWNVNPKLGSWQLPTPKKFSFLLLGYWNSICVLMENKWQESKKGISGIPIPCASPFLCWEAVWRVEGMK